MMNHDSFPAKLALGEQFCNRVKERQALAKQIQAARHTVLVSPRRYGKSSLVHYVIAELGLPFVSVDLFLAHDDKTITKRILDAISLTLSQLLSPTNKVIERISKVFNKFKVNLHLGMFSIELMNEGSEFDAVDQIYNALLSLEAVAVQEKKKVIFFIDEFQDIAMTQNAKTIQGAIRHVAQATQVLTFIFSGSNRHLLENLFDDKSMPLYMLCDKIYLERMTAEDYQPHLQKLSMQRWKKHLSAIVLQRIFTLTELHPFYVNFLCHKLWQGDYPERETVDECWELCRQEEARRIRAELEKLSRNQQIIMKALAQEPTIEPSGVSFSKKTGIAVSSLHQAVNTLYEKDMLYLLKEGQVRVLDPLITHYLRRL